MKFKKEFKNDHPETIGETDKEFDNYNYAEWLENKLQSYLDLEAKPKMSAEEFWENFKEVFVKLPADSRPNYKFRVHGLVTTNDSEIIKLLNSFASQSQQPNCNIVDIGTRPDIKDYFPEGTTVEQAHAQYVQSPNLFKYVQALDNYIDSIQSQQPANHSGQNETYNTANNQDITKEQLEEAYTYKVSGGDSNNNYENKNEAVEIREFLVWFYKGRWYPVKSDEGVALFGTLRDNENYTIDEVVALFQKDKKTEQ